MATLALHQQRVPFRPEWEPVDLPLQLSHAEVDWGRRQACACEVGGRGVSRCHYLEKGEGNGG